MNVHSQDYCKVLGVSSDASGDEVYAAYTKLLLGYRGEPFNSGYRRLDQIEEAYLQAKCHRRDGTRCSACHAAHSTKIDTWCKNHGFEDSDTQKKTFRGSMKSALHTAVKHRDPEIVGLMLAAGVNKDVRDSKGLTPVELAAKLNSHGSHNQILAILELTYISTFQYDTFLELLLDDTTVPPQAPRACL